MRVGLVSTQDPQDVRFWSGIPYNVLKALQRHTSHTEIIAPLADRAKWLYAGTKLFSRVSGHSVSLDRRSAVLKSYARQVSRRLRRTPVDALLCMSSMPLTELETDIPVIFWVDATLEGMARYYAGSFEELGTKELERGHRQEQIALDRATYAVYASDWAAETARQHYAVDAGKLQVVPFGANLEGADAASIPGLIERRMETACSLLWIGVEWERKGGPIALDTARELNRRGIPTRLRVVGCQAPEDPCIDQTGFISKNTAEGREKLKSFLSEATFFLLPSRAEAAGVVYCEASSFGLPIFATRTGGVPSYVASGENGFCLEPEAGGAEYAAVIARLRSTPEEYRALSMGAFSRYEKLLNWDVAVGKVLSLVS